MTLINQGASLPAPMWAVVRFLLSVGGEYPTERAQALLCPPSLLPDEEARAKDDTFRYAIKSLQELGLVSAGGGSVEPGAGGAEIVSSGSRQLQRSALPGGARPGSQRQPEQDRQTIRVRKTWSARSPGSSPVTPLHPSAWAKSPNYK